MLAKTEVVMDKLEFFSCRRLLGLKVVNRLNSVFIPYSDILL